MKLFSQQAEVRALFSICESAPKISSRLLAMLQKEHFHNPAVQSAFLHLRRHAKATGELLEWSNLTHDPELPTNVRKFLAAQDTEKLESLQKLRGTFGVLEKYRKLRIALTAGQLLIDSLAGDKAEPDKLLSEVADLISKARTKASDEQTVFHIGASNNSTDLLKDLLYGKTPPMVPTGYEAYDKRNGGFLEGSLVLLGAPTGGGKCLVGDTLVYTSNGIKRLDSFSSFTLPEQAVPIDYRVASIHGHSKATGLYEGYGKTLIVEMSDGTIIEGLSTHRLWTDTGWWYLKDLRKGAHIAKAFATRMFGTDNENIDFFQLGRDAIKKRTSHLPEQVFCASEKSQLRFIDGIRTEINNSWGTQTKKAHELKVICDNLGIPCRVRLRKRGERSHKPSNVFEFLDKLPDVVPNKGECINALLNVQGPPAFKDASKNLCVPEFGRAHVLWAMDLFHAFNIELPKPLEDAVYHLQWQWVTVENIKEGKERIVYDLVVPEAHSYVANGIVSHNTAMAVNVVRNMSEFYSRNCAIVSLEMNARQMMARIQSILTDIPLARISQQRLTKKEQIQIKKKYQEFVLKLKEQNTRLTVYTPSSSSLEEILYTLEPFGYDVILVDYVSLLDESIGTDEAAQWQKLGNVTKMAKRYAEAKKKIIILLVQVSPQGLVKYSRSMVEDANHCWIWMAPSEEMDIIPIEVQQLKARNLEKFTFQLQMISATGLIRDMDESERAQETESAEQESGATYMEDLSDENGD